MRDFVIGTVWMALLAGPAWAGSAVSVALSPGAVPPPVADDVVGVPSDVVPLRLGPTPVCAVALDPTGRPDPTAPWPMPRRVLLVGSSSMEWGFGPALGDALAKLGTDEIVNVARYATGLARPDHFDWHARLDEVLADFAPDLVVAQFGGNDAQHLRDVRGRRIADWETDAWAEAYANRVRRFVLRFTREGRRVVLIGFPRMEPQGYDARITLINAIVRRVAEAEGAVFVGVDDLTTTTEGTVATSFELDGRRWKLRQQDGIHLSERGAHWVAEEVARRIERRLDRRATCVVAAQPIDCAWVPDKCGASPVGTR